MLKDVLDVNNVLTPPFYIALIDKASNLRDLIIPSTNKKKS